MLRINFLMLVMVLVCACKGASAIPASPPIDVTVSQTIPVPVFGTTPTSVITAPTPVPDIRNIVEPLLIDGEAGRIYASANVDGQPKSVLLSATDGSLLAVYPYSGRLALDQNHHLLLVDQGVAGITVVDSASGKGLGKLELPVSAESAADPQVDPKNGYAYIFRKGTVYALDVRAGIVVISKTLSLPFLVCGQAQGNADIKHSFYDSVSSTLYMSLNTWSCNGFFRDTILVYDASTLNELGQFETASVYQAVAFAGSLYGTSQDTRLRIHDYWAHRNNKTWFLEGVGGSVVEMGGIVIDQKRELLYEDVGEHEHAQDPNINKQIRISSTTTRQLLKTVTINDLPVKNARLVGHDAYTDNLYFLEGGKLVIAPTTSILPVAPIEPRNK